MNVIQENNNNSSYSDELNIGRYLRLIFLQTKMIFGITLAGLLVGIFLYLSSTKIYKVSSLLQIYSPGQSFNSPQSNNIDFFKAPDTNLENLVTLYTSRSNILNLINGLNLNLKINDPEDKEILDIKTFLFKKNENYMQKFFYLEIQNNSFNLLDDKKNIIIAGLNGEYIENDYFNIHINFPDLSSKKSIEIIYRNPSNLYSQYKNKLRVSNLGTTRNFWTQEGLLDVSITTDDTIKGKKIIDFANKIFIEDNIKVETEKAKASMFFIDSQIESLEEILNIRKSELKNFKQENKSLNVTLEVQSIIELTSDIERKINLVDLEISQAEMNFTKDNPLYLNLQTQKEALEFQRDNIEKKIKNLPIAQQEYVDLFKNLEVSELLYSELVRKKLNFSLIEASSIGNIRVVDQAFVKNRAGPNITTPFFLTILAFFISILVAIFRGLFFIKISNPAELSDGGIEEKVVGVIPHIDDVRNNNEDISFNQSIETAILNIKTIFSNTENTEKNDGSIKIAFTSATPENGKSFISRSIAQELSKIGHKVLLIDADLKRGSQHLFFNTESVDVQSFDDISIDKIEKLKIEDNLYLLPKIKNLKNTFKHLYSETFIEKVKHFEDIFDFIIFDTAPVLSVSDTGLIINFSDINLLTVRHQFNKIGEIKQSKQVIEQLGRSFDGIIYNDYSKPKGYYGYYDLYGDYSYRYYAERYLYDDYYTKKND